MSECDFTLFSHEGCRLAALVPWGGNVRMMVRITSAPWMLKCPRTAASRGGWSKSTRIRYAVRLTKGTGLITEEFISHCVCADGWLWRDSEADWSVFRRNQQPDSKKWSCWVSGKTALFLLRLCVFQSMLKDEELFTDNSGVWERTCETFIFIDTIKWSGTVNALTHVFSSGMWSHSIHLHKIIAWQRLKCPFFQDGQS